MYYIYGWSGTRYFGPENNIPMLTHTYTVTCCAATNSSNWRFIRAVLKCFRHIKRVKFLMQHQQQVCTSSQQRRHDNNQSRASWWRTNCLLFCFVSNALIRTLSVRCPLLCLCVAVCLYSLLSDILVVSRVSNTTGAPRSGFRQQNAWENYGTPAGGGVARDRQDGALRHQAHPPASQRERGAIESVYRADSETSVCRGADLRLTRWCLQQYNI